MSIIKNGTNIDYIYFNGTKLDKVYFNNTLVYESWHNYSESKSGSWSDYNTTSPVELVIDTSGKRITAVNVWAEKSQHDGEYGTVHALAYYSGSWHEIATGGISAAVSYASWSGDVTYFEQVKLTYDFQLSRTGSYQLDVVGYE